MSKAKPECGKRVVSLALHTQVIYITRRIPRYNKQRYVYDAMYDTIARRAWNAYLELTTQRGHRSGDIVRRFDGCGEAGLALGRGAAAQPRPRRRTLGDVPPDHLELGEHLVRVRVQVRVRLRVRVRVRVRLRVLG